MKGIVKYNKQLYKRTKDKNFKSDDLILFIPTVHIGKEYIQYKGIYKLRSNNEFIIPNYKNNINLLLKIGYNVPLSICIKLTLFKK